MHDRIASPVNTRAPSPASGLAVAGWIISRIIMALFAMRYNNAMGDPRYYYRQIDRADGLDIPLGEYPDPATWPIRLLHLLTESEWQFIVMFAATMLLLDALFSWHLAAHRAWYAYVFWLAFGLVMAPLLLFRLDLPVGLAVAAAASLIQRRPRAAAAMLAVATAVKLWPVALATGLVGHWRSRGTWLRLGVFVLTLAAFAAVTVLSQGPGRVVSPLNYQEDRGLQSESVPGSLLLWQMLGGEGAWRLDYAPSKSYEIFGPGVDSLLIASSVFIAVTAIAALGVVGLRFLRTGGQDPAVTRVFWLALTLMILVTAKVFSPQYMLWLGPLVAVLLAEDRGRPQAERRLLAAIAVLTVVAGALSVTIFPMFFGEYLDLEGWALAVNVLRNVLVVAMAAASIWLTARRLRDESRRGAAPEQEQAG